MITGVVQTAKESTDISTVAARFIEEGYTIVNLLEVLGDQQVLLQVRIAEMQRNVLKTLVYPVVMTSKSIMANTFSNLALLALTP